MICTRGKTVAITGAGIGANVRAMLRVLRFAWLGARRVAAGGRGGERRRVRGRRDRHAPCWNLPSRPRWSASAVSTSWWPARASPWWAWPTTWPPSSGPLSELPRRLAHRAGLPAARGRASRVRAGGGVAGGGCPRRRLRGVLRLEGRRRGVRRPPDGDGHQVDVVASLLAHRAPTWCVAATSIQMLRWDAPGRRSAPAPTCWPWRSDRQQQVRRRGWIPVPPWARLSWSCALCSPRRRLAVRRSGGRGRGPVRA